MVGAKYRFARADSASTQYAVIGSKAINDSGFSLILTSEKTLNKWAFGYNIGWNRRGKLDFLNLEGYVGYIINSRHFMFVEYFGDYHHFLRPDHYVDFGYTFLVHQNLMLDAMFGKNLVEKDQYFAHMGFSYIFK